MSGDVQPRKRKDKRRKHEDESSHGVHITKMGTDDVHLHVQHDHGTGGHWCAKILFFSLLAVLLGLVALIILENRGLSDLDTPLSESRFSNYFDGWVDENREDHDHDPAHTSPEDHDHDDDDDDHDDDDEPFEEEEDPSEGDEDEQKEDDEEDEEEDDEEEEEDDDPAAPSNGADEDDVEESIEPIYTRSTQHASPAASDDNLEEDDDEDEDVQDSINQDEDDEDDNEEDNDPPVDSGDDNDNTANEDNDDDDDNDDEPAKSLADNDDDIDEDADDVLESQEKSVGKNDEGPANSQEDYDGTLDEDDNDDAFESVEKVVDNDAEELLLLRARQQEAEKAANAQGADQEKVDEDTDSGRRSWAASQINPKEATRGGAQSHELDTEADSFEEELRRANAEMMREHYQAALSAFSSLARQRPDKPEPFLGMANALDRLSEQKRSNALLREAIDAFKRYLAFDQLVANQTEYRAIAEHCIERIRFMGVFAQAVPIHHQLIERYPDEPRLRNQLVVTYLMMHRFSSAKPVLQEILRRWPTNGFAQVHYGFVLKQQDQDYKNAVVYLKEGIDSQAEGTQDGRFYFTLGDALQRLGRNDEAMEIYRKGAALQLFPSAYQRSLYNVPGLNAQPFWSKRETGYELFLDKLEANWQAIRDEGLSILSRDGYFIDEAENLRDSGDWKQFELYARGRRSGKNCQKAPITCSLVESFKAASECQRGQVKFSVMHPGTHVWPHCGPTNCRLRAHLGLVVPSGTFLRVADEENTWTEGKFVVFDDSFEHEVWHNGSSYRLVLIVDIWHPELTTAQRKSISAI